MINNVQLVGRLVKDPELRYTPTGTAVTRVVLAVRREFKSKQTGQVESDFVSVQIWRRDAENTANFMKKGDILGVTARIQTGSYEGQDGKRIYTTDIVASSVQFIHSQNRQGSQGGQGGQGNSNYQQNNYQQNNQQQNNQQQNNQQQNNQQQNNYLQNTGSQQQEMPIPQNYNQQNNRADQDPFAMGSNNIEISDDDLPF